MHSFDQYAKNYDDDFSNSKIGLSQRKRVWTYLDEYLSGKEKLEILELSGGTGEDVKFFLAKEQQVLYTDASQKMLEIARGKSMSNSNAEFKILDLYHLDSFDSNKKFDLIYSNFGGLNCIDEKQFKKLDHFANKYLKQEGDLILIVMPKHTILDRIYRILKGLPKIKRSSNVPTSINVEDRKVDTFFYDAGDLQSILSSFELHSKKVVGFFPSFFEKGFSKHPILWRMSQPIETLFTRFEFLVNYADHFLIHLKRKSKL